MLARLQIETPQPNDFPAVAQLNRTIQLSTYVGVTPELTYDVVSRHASPEWVKAKEIQYRTLYEAQAATIRIARLGDTLIGFCMLRKDGTDSGLAVDPQYQGGTVGPHLIWETVKDRKLDTPLLIHAVPGSHAARMYQRIGFTPVDTTIQYHQSPHVPEYRMPIMQLALSPEKAAKARQKFERLFANNITEDTLDT